LQTDTKEAANATKRPWISVVKMNIVDPTKISEIEMEFDWNEYFIQELRDSGYTGKEDEDLIEQWFHDLCHGIIADI
jgi:hypothetical protein